MRPRLVLCLLLFPLLTRAQNGPVRPGLIATYRDARHAVRLVVPSPSFYLESAESIHPSLAPAFEAEWTGFISIIQAADYDFDGSGDVFINGVAARTNPISLTPGRHPIRIVYRRKPGIAAFRLQWKSSRFPLEPVPAAVFFHPPSAAPADSVESGRALAEELGCANCHDPGAPSLQRRLGPHLTGIGSRVKSAWLYHRLARAGPVMPAMLEEPQRRDVAAYLASLQSPGPPAAARSQRSDATTGSELYGTLGCAACHQERSLALQGLGSKTSLAALAAYLKVPARFDPGGRMPSFSLTEKEALALAAFLVDSRDPTFEQPAPPGDPERGKAVVRSQGCLACHALEGLTNDQSAPPLAKLSPDRGCLAPSAPVGVPRYILTPGQRTVLQAFVHSYRDHPDVSPAPVYELRRALARLRCNACHQVDAAPPTGSPAESAPPLTDTGAKLRTAWIEQVLAGRRRILTWLDLRMPDYDSAHVRPLAAAFAKAAGVPPGDGELPSSAGDEARLRGADMFNNLACIGCHDWGPRKSTGEHGPQLINATERLRYEWYRRWMRDPARILSGTSMPNYFGSMKPDQAGAQIAMLWAAMDMKDRMPVKLPDLKAGVEERPVPGREAIVIRWDMPEATPAAIAVGLPGGRFSYCFDAGESRLRYAWHGGFVDMTGTLHRKTDANRLTPTAELIGEIFFRSQGFPFRVGAPDRLPQRRFRGYRLVGGVPQFHYRIDGIDVFERIVAAEDGSGLRREFTFSRVDQPVWFVEGEPREIPRGTNVRFEVRIAR